MTLQQLKYMIIVAERGSITEAAKELYISQPSLSGAVKEVEKEAGITIFSLSSEISLLSLPSAICATILIIENTYSINFFSFNSGSISFFVDQFRVKTPMYSKLF